SDAKPIPFREQSFINGDGRPFTTFAASGVVDIGPPGAPFLGTIIFMAGNGSDAAVASAPGGQSLRLFYHGDYARAGRVMIGDKSYDVLLEDKFTTGDFSGQTPPQPPHQAENAIRFLIDRGGTGHFSATDKFGAFASFAIDGVSYELSGITPSGDRLILGPSSQAVKELPVPPDLSVGKIVPAFVATTIDGKAIHFPSDYKGKIVALDFWATWCGPCLIEAPRLAEASAKYSSHGLAILGVSLDSPGDLAKLRDYAQKQQMDWPEIFDGKMWDSDLVMSYGLSSIPSVFLVDGDTGAVLAGPGEMTADQLMPQIEKAIERKGE
ncbi:MAG: TlpA disulfide reductase family protein, partial [Tepidisphaeraceae bacterium]